MRRTMLALAMVGCIGCTNPFGPDPGKDTAYLCHTQLRRYITPLPNGTVAYDWEIDTYHQSTPCPLIPIE